MDTVHNVTPLSGGEQRRWGADADLLVAALGMDPKVAVGTVAAILVGSGGSLRQAINAVLQGQVNLPGIGPRGRQRLSAALLLATRMAEQQMFSSGALEHPASCHRYLQYHYSRQEREVFTCLFLNNQHQLLACRDLFFGTLDTAAVYPREVAAAALRLGASAVIAAHNHPSGKLDPSSSDLQLTQRLRSALALLDIRLLDHLVIGQGDFLSMASEGLAGFS